MPIKDKSDLTDLLGTNDSLRIRNFVWTCLSQRHGTPPLWISTQYPGDHCRELLQQDSLLLEQIKSVFQWGWIPDHALQWIENNNRQVFWAQQYIQRTITAARAMATATGSNWLLLEDRIPHHLVGVERTIALVDYWSMLFAGDMSQRLQVVRDMASGWSWQIKEDQVFAWMDVEGGDVLRAQFWERLLVRHPNLQMTPAPNSHSDLLNTLDAVRLHRSELKLLSQEAKRRFQQQQRRADSWGKRRQCNFVLEEKTVSKLKNLAQKYQLNQTQLIELLIQEEAKNPVHITERLRRHSALTNDL